MMVGRVGAWVCLAAFAGASRNADPRFLPNGKVIAGLDGGYSDQPMCVTTSSDETWACTTTVTSNHEGGAGEHVAAAVSRDAGATWSSAVAVEPAPLVNAYNALWKDPGSGRLLALYGINDENVTTFPHSSKVLRRTDVLGHFRLRYSDDGGRSWSGDHFSVPLRETPIDARNSPFEGNVTMQWCVDKGIVTDGGRGVLVAFTKVGTFVSDPPEEVFFLHSPDLLAVGTDYGRATWRTVGAGPDGPRARRGLHAWPDDAPGVAAEPHVVPTPAGFYVVFRTRAGFLGAGAAPGPDGPWALVEGAWATYAADAAFPPRARRPLRNPRGPITPRLFATAAGATAVNANGTYLLLFYNDGGDPIGTIMGFPSRCVYWIAPGWPSADGATVDWGQPEVALYESFETCRDHNGPGYPDFIETGDAVYVTETNKGSARAHALDPTLVALLFGQRTRAVVADAAARDLVLSLSGARLNPSNLSGLPLPDLSSTDGDAPPGFTVEVEVAGVGAAARGARLLDTRVRGVGVVLEVADAAAALAFVVSDGARNATLVSSSDCAAALADDGAGPHQVAVVVDAGPSLVTMIVDGRMCDGGGTGGAPAFRGWASWQPTVIGAVATGAAGDETTRVGPDFPGAISALRVWATPLTTSEVLGNQRADRA